MHRVLLFVYLLLEDTLFYISAGAGLALFVWSIWDETLRYVAPALVVIAAVRFFQNLRVFRRGSLFSARITRIVKRHRGVKRCEFEIRNPSERAHIELDVCGRDYAEGVDVVLLLDEAGSSGRVLGTASELAKLYREV